ncbi:TPA: hypothetical protein ACXJFQ_005094 [Pseudomonas aeruginosa]
MECKKCGLCEEQVRLAQAREREAIAEAAKYRTLWEASASCLSANQSKIKPRGADESKLLEIARQADHGQFWSGKTKGWIA